MASIDEHEVISQQKVQQVPADEPKPQLSLPRASQVRGAAIA